MTEQKGQHSEQYQETRRKFDEMELEDKAVFLLESTISTVARGVEQFSRVVADSLEKTFDAAHQANRERANEENEAPSEPPSGPENGSADADNP